MKKIMTTKDDLWNDFLQELSNDLFEVGCDGSLSKTIIILKRMNYDIDKSVKYLEDNGGYCDCEVFYNVDQE